MRPAAKLKFKAVVLKTRTKLSGSLLALAVTLTVGVGIYIVGHGHAATGSPDINGDGVVNITDLSILLSHYGVTSATTAQGDINGDGAVSITDLSVLLSNWGSHPSTPTPSPTPTPTPTLTSTPTATPASTIQPTIVGHQLNAGTTGTRLKMHGVAVWGIKDQVTTSFGTGQYANRQTVINTIKAWGANEIRLRLLASDYDNQTYMTKAQEIQEIKDWQSTAQAAGLYLQVTWWDSLDGPYSRANWATQYASAFPMMNDVLAALGPTNPWVIYEPFNEPDNISDTAWLAAMKATIGNYRSHGYTGILLIDTNVWSHEYNDALMTQLEQYDAAQAGMNGTHQIIFAKHDYANEAPNPDSGFDPNNWAANGGAWNFSNHLVWETEFGNYNGDPTTVHPAWSSGAATWMAAKVNDGTLAGATAFLFGPWFDANAMTASDNVTPTQWGGYVKTNFLAAVH